MAPTSPPPDAAAALSFIDDEINEVGHATSSSAAGRRTHATASAAATGGAGAGATAAAPPHVGGDDIEMEALMGSSSHRRRTSSILQPSTSLSAGGGSSRAPTRAQQQQPHVSIPLQDEPKMSDSRPLAVGRGGGDDGDGLSMGGSEEDDGEFDDDDDDLNDDEETGLTAKHRDRRRRRKQRNTQLDQRIMPDGLISAEEKRQADQSVVRRLVVNAGLIGLWYIFSLCISLYNKWMFDQERLNFRFPLFTTSAHMLIQFALATLVLYFVPSLRPQNKHNSDMGRSRHEAEPKQPLMTKMFYTTRIAPCGAATSLDIGLGNMSLRTIDLSFYTMCKSSSLAFVLIFAFLFRLEVPTWRLVAIIATMTAGVIMMVFGEADFDVGGFVLVISAAFFSGFRWGLTQILLLRHPATSNPFSSIFFLAPVMFAVLFLLAVPVEGLGPLLGGIAGLQAEFGAFLAPFFLAVPGCIAFCMTASEFALLQRTSVVTLSIAGIFKEVITISVSSAVLGDRLTLLNFVGLLVTIVAIAYYNWFKITRMREQAQVAVHRGQGGSSSNSVAGGGGGGGAAAASSSSSDGEVDDGLEETGLLAHGIELPGVVVTSDGEVLATSPVNAPEPEHSHTS